MDLKVSGGVHLLDRLDGLRPPEGAKANKSIYHIIRLCRKQLAEYVEKTHIRQRGPQPQAGPVTDVTGHLVYRWVTHPYINRLIEDNMSETGGFANGTAYEAIDLTVEIIARDRSIDRLRRFLDQFPQSFNDEGSNWFKNRLRLRSSISE
ncbi:Pre-mRNA-processing protein 45 [Apiospora arundinis]